MKLRVAHTEEKPGKYWHIVRIAGLLILLIVAVVVHSSSKPGVHAQGTYQPTYLGGDARTGFNGQETIINPGTAPSLHLQWTLQPGGAVNSQVVEANGLLYWGSWDGYEHASNPSNGSDVWKTYLGQITKGGCPPKVSGVASTATIASVTINGQSTLVDFVGGGNASLYALDANTGAIIWQYSFGQPPHYRVWDSPAVFQGSVYIGVSSYGDCPLVASSLVKLDGATGTLQATFNVVPSGCVGGGIWGSPAIDDSTGMIYIATGNKTTCSTYEQFGQALVELQASDLSVVGSWQVRGKQAIGDSDFGSTPTLFQAIINGVVRNMVGMINKNGIYYAFDRTNISAGPLWKVRLAVPPGQNPQGHQPSIASSSWDGTSLYAVGGYTTINGVNCPGSVSALYPATGAFLWQVCLTGDVFSPVVSVPGLVVVGAGEYLSVLDATTGNLLYQFQDSSSNSNLWDWGTPDIVSGVLYVGNADGNLYAFAP